MADDQSQITSSMPPAERLVAVRGQWIQTILQTVFERVIEITIVVGATHAMEMGKLDPMLWLSACGFSATGDLVNRVRGAKRIVPTVMAIVLWISKAVPFVAMRQLLVPALALSLVTAPAGCAGVLPFLTTVVAAASTASDVINAISDFVATRVHDPSVDIAIAKARAALALVRDAAAGAKDIHDGDLRAAIEAWDAAYRALLAVTGPLGVHAPPEGGRLSAPGPNELIVPSAPKLRLSLEGRS